MSWRRWIACCGAASLAISHGVSTQPGVPIQEAAVSANYTYTVIADVTNCYNVGSPAIGNNGEVAFIGNCPTPTEMRVVRKGDGVTSTDVYAYNAVTGAYSIPDSIVSINDVGDVAFGGGPTGGGSTGYTILAGNGGPLTVVADTTVQTQWDQIARPSINNSGAVAFMAVASGTGSFNTVIRADGGGTFTTITEPGDPVPGGYTVHEAYEPALNNAGQVQISVNTTVGTGSGIYRGSGGPLTKIVVGEGNAFSGINDDGRVAFASGNLVKSGAGGSLTTIALHGAVFLSFSGVAAINNSNVVAFQAQTQAGPNGIFVGDGVLTQSVVQSGDVLPGLGTVMHVGMMEEAINDAGQVAFAVQYNDGEGLKSAIVRADPILPQISLLKFASTVPGCKNVAATVKLDRPTPPGGVLIDIDNTNPAASTPPSLRIASNKTSGKFVIAITPVGAPQAGAITTSLGSSTETEPLTVRPIGVQSLKLSPNPVVGGGTSTGTVTLECAAAPGDITVALSSTNPSVAQPDAPTLLFAAGTRTLTFPVNTSDVTTASIATIKATASGTTKKSKLTINP